MIPQIIHQIWHSPEYDRMDGTPQSWKSINPDWEYRLWLDQELEDFFAKDYPNLLELYLSFPTNVQRADLARYVLLHRFGGVYADMDTDCLAPLAPLIEEDGIVLCEEPKIHAESALVFGFNRLIFNGTIASPAEHPFWMHVVRMIVRNRHSMNKDVLISTGPVLLTAAVEAWADQERVIGINSCHLFAPLDKWGRIATDALHGDHAMLKLSQHNWSGSWYSEPTETRWQQLKGHARAVKARFGQRMTPIQQTAIAQLDKALLLSPIEPLDLQQLPQVAIFVPVRDAAPFIDRHMDLIDALDWPKDRLRLVYCEGDSQDASRARLEDIQRQRASDFCDFQVLSYNSGLRLDRKDRWKPQHQLNRRSSIAAARNRMISEQLLDDDEWVLWIDIDVCDFEPDVLRKLLAAKEKIVTPDCVLDRGGPSFDRNAYLEIGSPRRSEFFKYVTAGLFQPSLDYWRRLHIHDMRFASKVPLTAVGGTMLLVHGSIHRAGLVFPEAPYRYLIETEAFGRMARDAGVVPYGLPDIEVVHVKS
jgi:hypothetical protein